MRVIECFARMLTSSELKSNDPAISLVTGGIMYTLDSRLGAALAANVSNNVRMSHFQSNLGNVSFSVEAPEPSCSKCSVVSFLFFLSLQALLLIP